MGFSFWQYTLARSCWGNIHILRVTYYEGTVSVCRGGVLYGIQFGRFMRQQLNCLRLWLLQSLFLLLASLLDPSPFRLVKSSSYPFSPLSVRT